MFAPRRASWVQTTCLGSSIIPRGNPGTRRKPPPARSPMAGGPGVEHCRASKNDLKNQGTNHRGPASATVRATASHFPTDKLWGHIRPSPGCSGPTGMVICPSIQWLPSFLSLCLTTEKAKPEIHRMAWKHFHGALWSYKQANRTTPCNSYAPTPPATREHAKKRPAGYAQSIYPRVEGRGGLFFPVSYISTEVSTTINLHHFLHHLNM